MGWFKLLQKDGSLAEKLAVHKPQTIPFYGVHKTKTEEPETFMATLTAIECSNDQETYLEENHKFLFIEALKAIGRDADLMLLCKAFRDDPENYTFYVIYYLEPWFESLRL